MKFNWKITSLFIILLLFGVTLIVFVHFSQEKEELKEDMLREHQVVSRIYKLGRFYENVNNSVEVRFYPTDSTQDVIDRWEIISEVFPDIEYPKGVIEANDWMEADKIFKESLIHYHEENVEGKRNSATTVSKTEIESFFYESSISSNLQAAFDEKNINYDD
ncbi:hypothetical protein HXA35_01925 [Bacillus sp. A301a_S52]|jgi:hypothetical protein|nr:hypothetical protein [Bacillus sp. A301a_S52]